MALRLLEGIAMGQKVRFAKAKPDNTERLRWAASGGDFNHNGKPVFVPWTSNRAHVIRERDNDQCFAHSLNQLTKFST
jgi:hypothetical protein